MKEAELAEGLGIGVAMVARLKKRGMPSDSVESAKEWREKNLDITQTKAWRIDGNSGVKKSKGSQSVDDGVTIEDLHDDIDRLQQLDLETTDADELFKNSRALKEKALALQAAAEHEKFINSLVEKSVVEKIIYERGRQFRDGLMGLSRRLSPELIGMDDIAEVESMLNKEFREILTAFAKLPEIES